MPILFLAGCGSDDENSNSTEVATGISSYRFYYMDYPLDTQQSPENVDVVYNDGKIVKLIGDVSAVDPNTGYSHIFNKNAYTEVSYASNTATIIDKSVINEGEWNKQFVEFTADGKLKYKIYVDNLQPLIRDTIQYFYENGILKSYERHNRRFYEKSEIFYNANADVDSIVTRYPYYVSPQQPTFNPASKERVVRKFKKFDNKTNPFQVFVIFDEAFNRSLSAHNYSKWEEFKYDYDGHEIGNSFTEWTFIRENGMINFGL